MTDALIAIASFLISAGSIVLWGRGIRRVAIPENRTAFVAAWLVALALAVRALLGEPGWLAGGLAVLAMLGALLLLFTVAISAQKVGADVIEVGMTMPHFTALDEHGQPFDSAALTGDPLLLKFFRGHW